MKKTEKWGKLERKSETLCEKDENWWNTKNNEEKERNLSRRVRRGYSFFFKQTVDTRGGYGGLQGLNPGQGSLQRTGEQIFDTPVPGRGASGSRQGFHPGQGSLQRAVEQIVDIPVPGGELPRHDNNTQQQQQHNINTNNSTTMADPLDAWVARSQPGHDLCGWLGWWSLESARRLQGQRVGPMTGDAPLGVLPEGFNRSESPPAHLTIIILLENQPFNNNNNTSSHSSAWPLLMTFVRAAVRAAHATGAAKRRRERRLRVDSRNVRMSVAMALAESTIFRKIITDLTWCRFYLSK